MAELELVVTGDEAVAAAIQQAAGTLGGREMELALVAGALPIQNAAKSNVSRRTSTLARSIHIGGHTHEGAGEDLGGNSPEQVIVGTNLIYARIQEEGGEIEPVNREYLRFEIDGEVIFTKGPVVIPARPYLRPAFESQRGEAIREVANAVRDMLKAALG